MSNDERRQFVRQWQMRQGYHGGRRIENTRNNVLIGLIMLILAAVGLFLMTNTGW